MSQDGGTLLSVIVRRGKTSKVLFSLFSLYTHAQRKGHVRTEEKQLSRSQKLSLCCLSPSVCGTDCAAWEDFRQPCRVSRLFQNRARKGLLTRGFVLSFVQTLQAPVQQ